MRYVADVKTVAFSSLCFMSFVIQWAWRNVDNEILLTKMSWMTLTSLQAFQQAVSVHNFAHCAVFSNKMANNFFGMCLTMLSGAPASLYVPGHNESHHRHLETSKDVMRTSRMAYEREYLNLLLFFPTIVWDIQRNDMHYMNEQRKRGTALFSQFVREVLVYHAFLICIFWLCMRKALWVYFFPTMIGKYLIVTLNLLQHRGCDPNSRYNHSRNFTGPLLNFFCFNNGYHTQHHNTPGLHWSLLKQKHDEIEHRIKSDLLQSNMLAYIVKVVSNA